MEVWGGTAILSIAADNQAWLWDTLKHNVPPEHWRAGVDSNNWIASVHTIVDEKNSIITQQLFSNAFNGVVLPEIANWNHSNSNTTNSNSGIIRLNHIHKHRYHSNVH